MATIVARDVSEARASAVATAMRSVDVEPVIRLLARLPIADSLAAMMSDDQVWLVEPDEPNLRWIEREGALPHRRNVRVERIASEPAWAVEVAARALGKDLARRRLVVVQDRFAIRGRGVLLKPEVPFELLWTTGSVDVELRLPDGETRTVAAHACAEHVQTAGGPIVARGLTLVILDDIPEGTSVWLHDRSESASRP
jgi:hypothetical protein